MLSYKNKLDLVNDQLQFSESVQALCGGELSVQLETRLNFLKHDKGSSTLFLEEANIKKEVTFDDSYLEITIDQYKLKLPVFISFVRCKINSLKFNK